MAYFDYKVVPAPHRSKKAKGISDPAELFALTLTDAINEHARDGWEYLRAENMATQTPRGFLKRATEESVAVLVFRRERAGLDPQLEASPMARNVRTESFSAPYEPAVEDELDGEEPAPSHGGYTDRVQEAGVRRRQPPVSSTETPSPLRPSPKLGPVTRD